MQGAIMQGVKRSDHVTEALLEAGAIISSSSNVNSDFCDGFYTVTGVIFIWFIDTHVFL